MYPLTVLVATALCATLLVGISDTFDAYADNVTLADIRAEAIATLTIPSDAYITPISEYLYDYWWPGPDPITELLRTSDIQGSNFFTLLDNDTKSLGYIHALVIAQRQLLGTYDPLDEPWVKIHDEALLNYYDLPDTAEGVQDALDTYLGEMAPLAESYATVQDRLVEIGWYPNVDYTDNFDEEYWAKVSQMGQCELNNRTYTDCRGLRSIVEEWYQQEPDTKVKSEADRLAEEIAYKEEFIRFLENPRIEGTYVDTCVRYSDGTIHTCYDTIREYVYHSSDNDEFVRYYAKNGIFRELRVNPLADYPPYVVGEDGETFIMFAAHPTGDDSTIHVVGEDAMFYTTHLPTNGNTTEYILEDKYGNTIRAYPPTTLDDYDSTTPDITNDTSDDVVGHDFYKFPDAWDFHYVSNRCGNVGNGYFFHGHFSL